MSKAAVVQMISNACVRDNLCSLDQLFTDAHEQDVDLIVLPENFAFMGMNELDKLTIAEKYGQGEIQQAVSALAKRFGLWVIAGTVPLHASHKRVKASSIVYDHTGACVARYDKIHLFDVRISDNEAYEESLTIERGNDLVVVDTPIGHVGLSVCYDLRFPELYRELAIRGAEVFTVPSAFTAVTGLAHWEVLLRARAIENFCYVLAPNQGGEHANGRHTYGHSMIIEPWGSVVAEKQAEAGIVVADIDLMRLHELRHLFPCHDHHVVIT